MFINTYVFDHCENPNVIIDYPAYDDALPTTLAFVRNVAIHASCLSKQLDEEDEVWGKQLRFILSNFPSIKKIHILATAVLDTTRPSACPLPYEVFTTEAIGLDDRMRLGIVESLEDLKMCPPDPGKRPGNFVIQAWDDLETNWPTWKSRKQKAAQVREFDRAKPAERLETAPELWILGVAFFSKEWVGMEKNGEHGSSCKLVEARLNPAVKAAVRMEKGHEAPRGPLVPKPLRRRSTPSSTRSLKTYSSSGPCFGRFSCTTPQGTEKTVSSFDDETTCMPPLPRMSFAYSQMSQPLAKSQLSGMLPHAKMLSTTCVPEEQLSTRTLKTKQAIRKIASDYALTKKGPLFSLTTRPPAPLWKGRAKKTY